MAFKIFSLCWNVSCRRMILKNLLSFIPNFSHISETYNLAVLYSERISSFSTDCLLFSMFHNCCYVVNFLNPLILLVFVRSQNDFFNFSPIFTKKLIASSEFRKSFFKLNEVLASGL